MPAASAQAQAATGRVEGLVADRAVVQLDGGGRATVDPGRYGDDLTVEQVLRPGMTVAGTLDPVSGQLDVTAMLRPVPDALSDYAPGRPVWARMRQVRRGSCQVELWPGRTVWVTGTQVATEVDLRGVYLSGDVVMVTVLACDRDDLPDQVSLDVTDTDVDRVADAPSLLPGGPPWLAAPSAVELSRRLRAAAGAAPDPGPPEPSDPAGDNSAASPSRADLGTLPEMTDLVLDELDGQRARLGAHGADLTALTGQVERLQVELRRLKALVDDVARARGGQDLIGDTYFADPVEQLGFELDVVYARRTSPEEKRHLKMRKWSAGPQLFDSWSAVQGISRAKVVEVMVEILTDRAAGSAGRQIHQLRSGKGGDDPPVVRDDGATCWRAALQVGTPAARRLHYWHLADGSIEFASIRVHDDFRP